MAEIVISNGTLRLQDLIPTFLEALSQRIEAATTEPGADSPYRIAHISTTQELLGEIEVSVPSSEDDDNPYWTSEVAGQDLEDLSRMLNEFAPGDCYFGAHEGSSACFGFWYKDEPSKSPPDAPETPAEVLFHLATHASGYDSVLDAGDIQTVVLEFCRLAGLNRSITDLKANAPDAAMMLRRMSEVNLS